MSSIQTSLIGRKVRCCAPIAYNEKHAGETGLVRSVVQDKGLVGEVGLQVEWPDGSLTLVTSIDGNRYRLVEPEKELLTEDK